MKYSKFTAGLATAGLALALTGGVGLALPTAAHASAGQYIAEVEACDGELFTVPAAEFRSKSLGNYDVPAGMSFSLLDDPQVRHLITGQLAQIQPADGVTPLKL